MDTSTNKMDGLNLRLNKPTKAIAEQKTDIIINFTRSNLDLNKSVLRNFLGDDHDLIQNQESECRSKAPEGLEPGEFVVTRVENGLKANYIYHGCCISANRHQIWIDFKDYQTVIKDCFEAASSMGFNDITIPLFKSDICSGHPTTIQSELQFASRLLQMYEQSNKGLPEKTLRLVTIAKDGLFEEYKQAILNHKTREGSDQFQFKEDHFSKTQVPLDQTIERDEPSPPITTVTGTDTGHGTGVRPKDKTDSKIKQGDSASPWGKKDMFARGRVKGQSTRPAINIYIGDLAKVEVDALVHGTKKISDKIDFTTSVGRALKQAGGPELDAECSNLNARENVIRTIKVTNAGRLKCGRIIHIVTSQCRSQSEWVKVIWNCLEKADELGFLYIAFPALGSRSQSDQIKAEYFRAAIKKYTEEGVTSVKEIHIVVRDAVTMDIFKSVLISGTAGQTNPTNLMETKTPVFTSRNKLPKTVYKDVEIIVKEGDITDEQVDCIVHGFRAQYIMNDKYSPIDLSGGIGKCIQRKAGQAFMNDCLKKFVQYGEIAVTIGGDLPCRKVLHADINPCIGTTSTPSSWAIFVEKCLTKVFDMGMKSVSFPIIRFGFLSARTLAEYQILGVKRFIDSKPKLIETITFVTQNNEEADTVFRDEIYKLCRDKQRKEDGPRFATDSSAVPNPTTLGGRTYAQATRPRVTLSVEVVLGDITKDDSDMIVHPTSNSLHGINFVGQPGVSISQVGGTSFNEECRSTTVQPKSYTVTNPGSLPCKKVLHVDAYSILGDDKDGWKRVIVSALKVANDYKMTSIAFTTFKIGTVHTKEDGVRLMAKCFKEAIDGYSPTHSTLKIVRFVVYKDQALYKILNEILAKPKSASVQADTSTPDNEYTLAITGSELVLTIVCGDLTTQRCGAIVHATGNPIHFGGKSGDAIKKAGGPLLEAAVKIARYKDTPVVFTQAGNLPCGQVLHLDMTCSKHENKIMKLKTLIMESLAAAEKEHIGVLSYPALGTGKWGCQPSQISTCFKDAISEFSDNQRISHLHEIRLVVFETSMMQEFTQTLDTI